MKVDTYLIDNNEYFLIKENVVDDKIFCYFVNTQDSVDIIIKKRVDNDKIVAITEEEFELAIKSFNK